MIGIVALQFGAATVGLDHVGRAHEEAPRGKEFDQGCVGASEVFACAWRA